MLDFRDRNKPLTRTQEDLTKANKYLYRALEEINQAYKHDSTASNKRNIMLTKLNVLKIITILNSLISLPSYRRQVHNRQSKEEFHGIS